MEWACAVTTVSSRLDGPLKSSVESILNAGFPVNQVCVDGPVQFLPRWLARQGVVQRSFPCKAFGNWCLALQELLFRFPEARRYAIFQDDVLCSRGVREYVERMEWEPRTYLNLVTYPAVAQFRPSKDYEGWFPSSQRGKGAQALVFDREGATRLLTSRQFFDRRFDVSLDSRGRPKGTRNIDGGVVDALKLEGYTEVCHYPSLVTHLTDVPSAINNSQQPEITSWRGEEFDATSLLR